MAIENLLYYEVFYGPDARESAYKALLGWIERHMPRAEVKLHNTGRGNKHESRQIYRIVEGTRTATGIIRYTTLKAKVVVKEGINTRG